MKRIDDQGGMRQFLGHAVGVAPVRVDGHGVRAGQPRLRPAGQPCLTTLALRPATMSSSRPGDDVHEPGDEDGVAAGVGPQERGLVEAQATDRTDAAGVLDQGLP